MKTFKKCQIELNDNYFGCKNILKFMNMKDLKMFWSIYIMKIVHLNFKTFNMKINLFFNFIFLWTFKKMVHCKCIIGFKTKLKMLKYRRVLQLQSWIEILYKKIKQCFQSSIFALLWRHIEQVHTRALTCKCSYE